MKRKGIDQEDKKANKVQYGTKNQYLVELKYISNSIDWEEDNVLYN